MWTDPIVEEIHKIRQAHAAKFNYNVLAIVKEYQMQQRQSGTKVISFINKRKYKQVDLEKSEASNES